MSEVVITVDSSQSFEEVIKEVENCLTQIGQATITKKGVITVNPKAKYTGVLSKANSIEGTVRQKREGQFDIVLTYSVSATIMCWVIGIFGGLCLLLPVAVFAVPYYSGPKSLGEDIHRALERAQQELE